MFILKDKTQIEKAIAKAKQIHPKVHFITFGHYQVSGSRGYYTVLCKKSDNSFKTVVCTCKGAEKGLVCYHAVAAIAVHIGLAKQRQSITI